MVDNRGNKRKQKLKAESQDVMRERLCFSATLNVIDEIEDQMYQMVQDEDLDTPRIQAMKVLLDTKYRRINKLLPDLKAVEQSVNHSGDLFKEINLNVVANT